MNFKEEIEKIKLKFMSGSITYEQAKWEADPIIKKANQKALEIAKKYGKKPIKIKFTGLFR